VTSYLFSWLRSKFGGSDEEAFRRLHPHDWLVWEAGPWHPPEKAGHTLLGLGAAPAPKGAGESLAIALRPNPRRPYLTLGRGPENDVVIDDATLSRVHLVLMRPDEGAWTVRDAGSSNGSRLDGRALEAGKPEPLPSGARIEAGSVHLTFLDSRGLLERLRAPTPA